MKTSTAIGFAQGSSDSYAGRDYDDTPPSQLRNRAQIKNYKLGYKHGYKSVATGDASGFDLNAVMRDVAKTAQSVQAAIPQAQKAIVQVQQATPQIKDALASTQKTLASTQQTVASIKSTGEWFKKNWYWLALGVGGSIAAIIVTVKMLQKPKATA